MKLDVMSSEGKPSQITAVEAVFGCEYNEALLHDVVTNFRMNSRSGNSAQLTRSGVRGGGAKPWAQKGTGRARAGTSRSPIWRGGGVTFASTPKTFNKKINRKVYRQAMRIMFSELIRKERMVLVDKIDIAPKTKDLVQWLSKCSSKKVLIITKEVDTNVALASRNLKDIKAITVDEINPLVLLQYETVCMSVEAIQFVEGWLG